MYPLDAYCDSALDAASFLYIYIFSCFHFFLSIFSPVFRLYFFIISSPIIPPHIVFHNCSLFHNYAVFVYIYTILQCALTSVRFRIWATEIYGGGCFCLQPPHVCFAFLNLFHNLCSTSASEISVHPPLCLQNFDAFLQILEIFTVFHHGLLPSYQVSRRRNGDRKRFGITPKNKNKLKEIKIRRHVVMQNILHTLCVMRDIIRIFRYYFFFVIV